MFDDERSQRIVLVSHCILNQNAISDGTADYPGTFKEVVNRLVEEGVGIIQMPCPELLCLGLDRGDVKGSERAVVEENTRIRKELLTNSSQEMMEQLVQGLFLQVKEYLKNGFSIQGIIGINRSPSCGVNTTSERNQEIQGEGVFVKKLLETLKQEGISVDVVGIKTSIPEDAVKKVDELLSQE